MTDFLFRGTFADLDPDLFELSQLEAERQTRKIILIASESQAPLAIREALGSTFHNIYAEGYPPNNMRDFDKAEILNYDMRLAEYRRYSDNRYYKGVEYANIAEAIARLRCAETFAANGIPAGDIFVNVQPLSGAPANNAVYHALAEPGDTIMGLSLIHGGHLTHGSPVNRSGKYYNAVHYQVDPKTERINYDQVADLARKTQPKFIIAGYSSYPWTIDWNKFKEIAQSCGAYLIADIAHVAGLVAGGVFPSPVGIADVITFTTHKSLCGPRGACILTTNSALARKLDRAVFPGEQGGPHVNVFVAMALAFKLAQTNQFKKLQNQIVENAIALGNRFAEHDLRIPFGGTNTHMVNLDCRTITGGDGTTLSGDQAARILDIAGIVVNRNTIPGDSSALDPSGIRIGTTWITQRGFTGVHLKQLAEIIVELLNGIKPYSIAGRSGNLRRAKVDFNILEESKVRSRRLVSEAGADYETPKHGYPHFYFIEDKPDNENPVYKISGERVREFLMYCLSSDTEALQVGESQATSVNISGEPIDATITRIEDQAYTITVHKEAGNKLATWLRDLSDGYIKFDDDLLRKIPGPIVVRQADLEPEIIQGDPVYFDKPYFIGIETSGGNNLPEFEWHEGETPLYRTPVYETHKELGAKLIPFAGWEMPVWYTSVMEEHLAVRECAGIFDVAHMGVYQVEGEDAAVFLDSVVGNDIGGLAVGESCYTHFLDPNARVIDDLLVYRRGLDKVFVVVNAANDDKDWAWLNAVRNGEVRISNQRPWAKAYGRDARLRNLRDPKEGEDMRVDIALQGPKSRDILLTLGADEVNRQKIMGLKRTQLCDAYVGGFDLIVSRTGYTGEKMAFELFVHPSQANALFVRLLDAGEPFGLKPIGLGARDSLRTEAGLPLYGHEMGGEKDLGVGDAGFGSYVKTYKPWFIGRNAFINQEKSRSAVVNRFRFDEKGVRMAHYNDPVMDRRGRVIGFVTSCAVDADGYLTGQAYLDLKSAEIGNQIYIFQSADTKTSKPSADLEIGDRVRIPTSATIISRFP